MTGARARFTTRADGDLAPSAPGVEERRQLVRPGGWTWLHQVHGDEVVIVRVAGDCAGADADAIVTDVPGAVLGVQVADCAPIALLASGAVGVVHAGWRGASGQVIDKAIDAMRSLSAGSIRAMVGPCIETGCYEFGQDELERLVAQLGGDVRGTTRWGTPAFDLRAAVVLGLQRAGITDIEVDERCTACDPDLWSHRAAGDPERQAVVAWLET